jgi:hypothetical protein
MYNFFKDRTAGFDKSIFKKELKENLHPISPEAETILSEITSHNSELRNKGYEAVVSYLKEQMDKKNINDPSGRARFFDEWLIKSFDILFTHAFGGEAETLFMKDGFLTKMDEAEYNKAIQNSKLIKLVSEIIDHLNVDLNLNYTSSIKNIKHIIETLRNSFAEQEGGLEDQDYWKHDVKIDSQLLRKFNLTEGEAKKPIKNEKELLPKIANFLGMDLHFGTKVLPEEGKSNESYTIVKSKDKNRVNKNELSRNKKTIEEMLLFLADSNPETKKFINTQIKKYGKGGDIEGYVDRILKIFSSPTKPGKWDKRFSFFFGVLPTTNFAKMPFEDFAKSLSFLKRKYVDKNGNGSTLTKEKLEEHFPSLEVAPAFREKAMHQKEKGEKSNSEIIIDELKELPLSEGVKILSSYFKHVKDSKDAAGVEIQNRFKDYLEGDLVNNAERLLKLKPEKQGPDKSSDPIAQMPGKVQQVKRLLKNVMAPFRPAANPTEDPTFIAPSRRPGESDEDYAIRKNKSLKSEMSRGSEVKEQLENLRDIIKNSLPPEDVLESRKKEIKEAYKSLTFSEDKKENKMLKEALIGAGGAGATFNAQLSSEEGFKRAIKNLEDRIKDIESGTGLTSIKSLEDRKDELMAEYKVLVDVVNAVNNYDVNADAFDKNIADIKSSLSDNKKEFTGKLNEAKARLGKLRSEFPEMEEYYSLPGASDEDRAKADEAAKEELARLKEEDSKKYGEFKNKLDSINSAIKGVSSVQSNLKKFDKDMDSLPKDSEDLQGLNKMIGFAIAGYEDALKSTTSVEGKLSKVLAKKQLAIQSKVNAIDKAKGRLEELKKSKDNLEGKWDVLKGKVGEGSDYQRFVKQAESFKEFVDKYAERLSKDKKKAEEVTGEQPTRAGTLSHSDYMDKLEKNRKESEKKALKRQRDWDALGGDPEKEAEFLKNEEAEVDKELAEKAEAKAAEKAKSKENVKFDFKELNALYSTANDLYNLFNNLAQHVSADKAIGKGGRFFEYKQEVSPLTESSGSSDKKAPSDPKEYVARIDDIISKIELFDTKKLEDLLNRRILKVYDPSVDSEQTKKTIDEYLKKIDGLRKDIKSLLPEEMLQKVAKYLSQLSSLAFIKKSVKLASSPFDVARSLRLAGQRIIEAAGTEAANWFLFGERYVNVDGKGQKVTTPKMFEFTDMASEFVDSLMSHGFDFIKDPKNFEGPDGKFDQEKFNAALETQIDDTVDEVIIKKSDNLEENPEIDDIVGEVVIKGADNLDKYLVKELPKTYLKRNESILKDFMSKKERVQKMQQEIVEIKEKNLDTLDKYARFLKNPRKSIESQLNDQERERFQSETGQSVAKEDLDEFKKAVLDKDVKTIKSMLSPKHLDKIEENMPGIWDGLATAKFSPMDRPQKDPLASSILKRLLDLYKSGESTPSSAKDLDDMAAARKAFKDAIKSKDVGKIKELLPEEARKDPYLDDILDFISKDVDEKDQSGLTDEVFGGVNPFDYLVDLFKQDKGALAQNRKRLKNVKKEMGRSQKDRKLLIDRDYFKKNVGKLLESFNPNANKNIPEGKAPTTVTTIKTYYKDFEEFSKKISEFQKTLSKISATRDNNARDLRNINSILRGYDQAVKSQDSNLKTVSRLFVGLKDAFAGGVLKSLSSKLKALTPKDMEFIGVKIDRASDNVDSKGSLSSLRKIVDEYKNELFKEVNTYSTISKKLSQAYKKLEDFGNKEQFERTIKSIGSDLKGMGKGLTPSKRSPFESTLDKAISRSIDEGGVSPLNDFIINMDKDLFPKDYTYDDAVAQIDSAEDKLKEFSGLDKIQEEMSKEGVITFKGDEASLKDLADKYSSAKSLLEAINSNLGAEDNNTKAIINSLVSVHNSILETLKKVESLKESEFDLTLRSLKGEDTFKIKGIDKLREFVTKFNDYDKELSDEKSRVEESRKDYEKENKIREVERKKIDTDDKGVAIETEKPEAKKVETSKEEIDIATSFADEFSDLIMKSASDEGIEIVAKDLSFLSEFKAYPRPDYYDIIDSYIKVAGTGEPEEKGPKEIKSDKKLMTPLFGVEDKDTLEFILNKKVKDVRKIKDLVAESGDGIDKLTEGYLKQIAAIKRKGAKEISNILKKEYSIGGVSFTLEDLPYKFRDLLDTTQEQLNKRVLNINGLKEDLVELKEEIDEMKNYIDFETKEVKGIDEGVISFYKKIFFKDLLVALNQYWNTNAGRHNLFGEKEMPAFNEIYNTVNNLMGTKVKPIIWKNLAQIDQELKRPLERAVIRSKGVSDDVIVKTDKKSRLAEVKEYIRQYERMIDIDDESADSKGVSKVQKEIKDYKDLVKEKNKILQEGLDKVTEKEVSRLQEIEEKLNATSLDKLENDKKKELLKFYYGKEGKRSGVANTLEYLYSEVDRLESLKSYKKQLYIKMREAADEKMVEDTISAIRAKIDKERSDNAEAASMKKEYENAAKKRSESVDKAVKEVEEVNKKLETELSNVTPEDVQIEKPKAETKEDPTPESKEEESLAKSLIKGVDAPDIKYLNALVSGSKKALTDHEEIFKKDPEAFYGKLEGLWRGKLKDKPEVLKKVDTEIPGIVRDLDGFAKFLTKSMSKAASYEDSAHFDSKHLYSKAMQDKIASMLDI